MPKWLWISIIILVVWFMVRDSTTPDKQITTSRAIYVPENRFALSREKTVTY